MLCHVCLTFKLSRPNDPHYDGCMQIPGSGSSMIMLKENLRKMIRKQVKIYIGCAGGTGRTRPACVGHSEQQ